MISRLRRLARLLTLVVGTPMFGLLVAGLIAPGRGESGGGAAIRMLWPLLVAQALLALYLAVRVWRAEQ